jgi:hypothetical protein
MHNVTAKPASQYGSETCGLSEEDIRRTEAFGMKQSAIIVRCPGAHPASYLMGTGGYFPWAKAAGA